VRPFSGTDGAVSGLVGSNKCGTCLNGRSFDQWNALQPEPLPLTILLSA